MSLVLLVSGGMDSSLMSVLAHEDGIVSFPLFVDYGQLCRSREWTACKSMHRRLGLPMPVLMDVSGFGRVISSGLTNRAKDVFRDAFLPGRNLLFLLAASAYACEVGADAVAIGLLHEETHLFPDQTAAFLAQAESVLTTCMGRPIRVLAPLSRLYKSDVLHLAERHGVTGSYSCHTGSKEPCGICVSCREIIGARKEG